MSIINIDVSTRVLYESLGSKNIEVDSIVIAEQIKNARDAAAKNIVVDFRNYSQNEMNIYDDGVGMDYDDISNNWFLIGTKNKFLNQNSLGGKGIGRLSLFRLANSVTVITKKKNNPEYEFTFHKESLEKTDTTRNLEIEIVENKKPKFFIKPNSAGTKIILKELKEIDFNEIYLDLYNLVQPNIDKKEMSNIKYFYPNTFVEPQIMKIEDSIKYAPFKCNIVFNGNTINKYEFKCNFKGETILTNLNPKGLLKEFNDSLPNSINLGNISFHLYNFYFDRAFISKYSIPQKDIQDNFLSVYQGISVYREKFKIYGHGKNDWLKLAEKRVNQPSKRIDNRLSFGYISLSRPDSDTLEEKTSREGFIKNKSLEYFTNAFNLIIEQFNKDRLEAIKSLQKCEFSKVDDINSPNGSKASPPDPSNNTKKSILQVGSHKDQPFKADLDKGIGNSLHNNSDIKESNNDSLTHKSRPTPKYSNKIIIDHSYTCPSTAPEKIKRIIHELQQIKHDNIYAQGLLLRCLIDISTQYAQKKLPIKQNINDLFGNINNVLNYLANKKLIDRKHIDRVRVELKQNKTVSYFNGIAHEYDYRTNYDDIKRIWDAFEHYIGFCIKQ